MEIVINYQPRFPQGEIHEAIESRRFSVIVLHRRCGKTVLAVNHLIKKATTCQHFKPKYAYVAPYLKQAKLIAWDFLKYYTKNIPKTKYHEGELFVELINGARIYIFGADNPDALRGIYLDGVILDEYADIKPEVFNEIVRPALVDRSGFCVFMGTPKGQNHFYEMYLQATERYNSGDPDWYSVMYSAEDTKVIKVEELEQLRVSMTESAYRQEMLCSFDASVDNILIDLESVNEAMRRTLNEDDYSDYPVVMAVDPARFGDDSSVVVWKRGKIVYEPKIYKKMDNMTLAGNISRIADDILPRAILIDAGRGEGVIDRLRQLGYPVIEVNFGESPFNVTKHFNRRAEMWDELREFIKQGGQLPKDVNLKLELTSVQYSYTPKNQLKLESKQDVKDRLGRSPDIADACALLFAQKLGLNRYTNLQKMALT